MNLLWTSPCPFITLNSALMAQSRHDFYVYLCLTDSEAAYVVYQTSKSSVVH